MTQEEYFKRFQEECNNELQLTKNKNADYADIQDAFANFRQIEHLTSGRISVEAGILTRMSDKFTRVANLLARPAAVADESILDTLRDISVYAKILRIYLQDKKYPADKPKGGMADVWLGDTEPTIPRVKHP